MFLLFHSLDFFDEDLKAEFYSKSNLVLGGVVFGLKAISGCFNMVIAVERCICVVLPHRASSLIRTRTMGVILLAFVLVFQGSYLTYPFSYRVQMTLRDGRAVWGFNTTQFYEKNKLFIYTLLNTVLDTVVPCVTFCVVAVSTAVTVRTLTASITWRGKTSSATSDTHVRQVALTRMLVIVSCVYVVTMVPSVARKLSFWFVGDYLPNTSCLDIFNAVTAAVFTVSILSSSFNFFVYYSRSSRYQAVIREYCC